MAHVTTIGEHEEEWTFQYRKTFKNRTKLSYLWLNPVGEPKVFGKDFTRYSPVKARPGAIFRVFVDYKEDSTLSVTQTGDDAPHYLGMIEDEYLRTIWQAKDRSNELEVQTIKRAMGDTRRNLIREALQPLNKEYHSIGRTGRAAFLALVIDEVTR